MIVLTPTIIDLVDDVDLFAKLVKGVYVNNSIKIIILNAILVAVILYSFNSFNMHAAYK
jgi:hypothetical protein